MQDNSDTNYLAGIACGAYQANVRASAIHLVIACLDATPVFEAFEHDLDYMTLSIENGVVGDMDFVV